MLESGHTVLIGWNDRSLGFIEQIAIAKEDFGGGIIVVMVEKGSEEIERKFLSQTTKRDLKGTKVIFRTGEPQSLASLKLVGIATARSIVLMSSGDDPRIADANTLRILIALRVAGLQPESYIVAEGTCACFDPNAANLNSPLQCPFCALLQFETLILKQSSRSRGVPIWRPFGAPS